MKDELEKLNKHTDEINKLELQLEDANCLFRTLLTDSTQQLKALSQKVGKNLLFITRKYPLRGYILGVLTHTTAWDRHGEMMRH